MTMRVSYTIYCQGAGCSVCTTACDNEWDVEEEAEAMGIERVRVQNGSLWDLCPKCHAKYLRDNK